MKVFFQIIIPGINEVILLIKTIDMDYSMINYNYTFWCTYNTNYISICTLVNTSVFCPFFRSLVIGNIYIFV